MRTLVAYATEEKEGLREKFDKKIAHLRKKYQVDRETELDKVPRGKYASTLPLRARCFNSILVIDVGDIRFRRTGQRTVVEHLLFAIDSFTFTCVTCAMEEREPHKCDPNPIQSTKLNTFNKSKIKGIIEIINKILIIKYPKLFM